ncbi:hypothetical protein HRG_000018 [Hirsutella rhossiliensis]|uniref:Uncharacterized protein n=1 Tax=Hirsutella rhossiliensis TaxID=111463 RepID=A0A9P8N7G7_9HYPO|nr:uncharacterized protein HRG_00018 [Hirsutella rhossiliensis]KAH0967376.1 hypothetical protein HRG_00018 [Hirsutella rhossiliensis]
MQTAGSVLSAPSPVATAKAPQEGNAGMMPTADNASPAPGAAVTARDALELIAEPMRIVASVSSGTSVVTTVRDTPIG